MAGAPPAPRLWTPFVTLVLGFAVGTLGIVATAAVVAAGMALAGAEAADIQTFLSASAPGMVLVMAPVQVGILAAALAHAMCSRSRPASGCPSIRETLGLRGPPWLGIHGWCALVVGSGVPMAAALAAASVPPHVIAPEAIAELWSTMSLRDSVLWVAFIAALPGIGEELLFRGLLQRRLLQRWSPSASIAVSSILFALVHVDPPAIALALVLGVWLGIVAWRTDSVLPGIVIHATVNGSWNIGQIVVQQGHVTERTLMWTLAGIGVVSVVAFICAVAILVRARRTV